MKTVVCPGSFDPVTNGHVDIIQRASGLFDRVIVLVAYNAAKQSHFTVEERMAMLRKATGRLPNVEVDCDAGLLVDYLQRVDAHAIVKGLRAVSDFEYEFQMALTNRKLLPGCDTIFFTTSGENMYLSSSIVRQVCSLGGDISGFVPDCVRGEIVAKLRPQQEQERG